MTDSHARARADRIREKVDLADLLEGYGYYVRGGVNREQQFPCNLHGDGSDQKPSARVYPDSPTWYCVAEDERVLTSEGWLPLKDLRHREVDALNGLSQWERPTFLERGERSVLRVETTAGYSVKVTPDHEVYVQGVGWTLAGSLKVGDVLQAPLPSKSMFGHGGSFPEVEDINAKACSGYPNITVPKGWSVELGEVVGVLFGDGYLISRPKPRSSIVGFTTHATDVADGRRVFEYLKAWAPGRGSETHRTDTARVYEKVYTQDQYVFKIANNGLYEFFQRLGLTKSKVPAQERRLPDSLWDSPECALRGFLRGIFASDGSVYVPKGRRNPRVTLSSVSSGFLSDVQLVLFQFGIHSRVYPPCESRIKEGPRAGKRTHPAGYLQLATGKDILHFRERVGIGNTRKQAVLDGFRYNSRGVKPFRPRVKAIESVGIVPVADLSMPNIHSFVAGGIKVHNCFGCQLSRDAIATVQAIEGLEFWPAIKFLEKKYNLPPLKWDGPHDTGPSTVDKVASGLSRNVTFSDDLDRLCHQLDRATKERSISMKVSLRYWEAVDKVAWHVLGHRRDGSGPWSEREGKVVLGKLRERLQKAIAKESS